MEKRQSLQQMVLGNLDGDMQKSETGPLSYPIHKNKFKMDERPKCQTGNYQNPRGQATTSFTSPQHLLTRHITKGKGNKSKHELSGLRQDKKLLHREGTINKIKSQPKESEKIFTNDISDKGLASKAYKELMKLNTPKQATQ